MIERYRLSWTFLLPSVITEFLNHPRHRDYRSVESALRRRLRQHDARYHCVSHGFSNQPRYPTYEATQRRCSISAYPMTP
jgi:hypothetical protein